MESASRAFSILTLSFVVHATGDAGAQCSLVDESFFQCAEIGRKGFCCATR